MVGLNYGKLYAYLRELGINDLWYLSRNNSAGTGRCLVPMKESSEWWLDDFWKDKVNSQ